MRNRTHDKQKITNLILKDHENKHPIRQYQYQPKSA